MVQGWEYIPEEDELDKISKKKGLNSLKLSPFKI
jgi:hypothetical protein